MENKIESRGILWDEDVVKVISEEDNSTNGDNLTASENLMDHLTEAQSMFNYEFGHDELCHRLWSSNVFQEKS